MRRLALLATAALLPAAPAAAQAAGRAPLSIGGDIGMFAPFEGGSSSSFTARATADLYLWGPAGLRFAAGFANPELEGEDVVDQRADVVYASAGLIREVRDASLRPYGHIGVGIYHFTGDRNGTQLGLSAGGGLEFPVGADGLLLTPELTAHVISGDAPRFSLALTVGLHTRPR